MDTRRCDADQLCDGTPSYACWVDGEPCEVAERFRRPLLIELAVRRRHVDGEVVFERADAQQIAGDFQATMNTVEGMLPCHHCRVITRDADKLSGVRLGRHERRALLLAPPADDKPQVLDPEGEGRSADEAHRRSIRTLAQHGLIHVAGKETKVRRRVPRLERPFFRDGQWWHYPDPTYPARAIKQAAQLTPLGQAVVGRLKAELEDGRPIRWAQHRPAIIAAARADSAWLLERFRVALARRKEDLHALFGLLAVVGSRGGGDYLERAERISHVEQAIDEPCQTPGEKEQRLRAALGAACPRCHRHIDGAMRFTHDGPTLCRGCWAELGQAWQASQQTA